MAKIHTRYALADIPPSTNLNVYFVVVLNVNISFLSCSIYSLDMEYNKIKCAGGIHMGCAYIVYAQADTQCFYNLIIL